MAVGRTKLKPKVILFLGSGFSAALNLPTGEQLSNKLMESFGATQLTNPIEHFISITISEFWKTVFGWSPDMEPPALEDHFTQIDMAANLGHHLGSYYGPRELRAIRRMTIHRIFSLLTSSGIQDVK